VGECVQPFESRSSLPVVPRFLQIDGLTAGYEENGQHLPVLVDLTFSVGEGEFVSVIGPSGSGKSTLLDIIAGLIEPDCGELLIGGQRTGASERLGISAYMKQRDLLLPWRTVVENAALALEVGGMPRRTARAEAMARLDEFGLTGFGAHYPAQLSGGMRQRVALLRTMLAGRSLILLDEPFGALDAITRATMQDWLLKRVGDHARTVILVTHDVEEAIFIADRVIVLTGRPARVAHTEVIDLPRPRTRAMVTEGRFVAHKTAVMTALGLFSESRP